jgi:hypothetical protein
VQPARVRQAQPADDQEQLGRLARLRIGEPGLVDRPQRQQAKPAELVAVDQLVVAASAAEVTATDRGVVSSAGGNTASRRVPKSVTS